MWGECVVRPHPLTIPEIHLLIPNPQCDNIWRQSFGRWLDHDGGGLMNWICSLQKEALESSLSLFLVKSVRRWPSVNQERGPHQTQTLPKPWVWTSKPLPQLFVRNKFLLFISYLVYGILLMSAGMDWDTLNTQTCNYWTSYSLPGTAKYLGIFSIVLTAWHVKLLSHVWLCDPMECSLPGSSIHGIFQAIVLEWVTISLGPLFLLI